MFRFEKNNPSQIQTPQPITGTVASLGLKRNNMGYAVGATETALLATVAKAKASESLGPAHVCQATHALAEFYELNGQISEAKVYYAQTCDAMDAAKLPPDASDELKSHYMLEKAGYYANYAICLAKNKEFKESITRRQSVVAFMASHFGRTSPYMKYPLEQLIRGYEMIGDNNKCAECQRWLATVQIPPNNTKALPPRRNLTVASSTSAASVDALAAAAQHVEANAAKPVPLLSPNATRAIAAAKESASAGRMNQAYVMARTALQLAEVQEKQQQLETDVLAEPICLLLGMICTHGGGDGNATVNRLTDGEQYLRRAMQFHYRAATTTPHATASPAPQSAEALMNASGLSSIIAAAGMSDGDTKSDSKTAAAASSVAAAAAASAATAAPAAAAPSASSTHVNPLRYVTAQRELGTNLMSQWRWNEALAFLLAAADTYARHAPAGADRAHTTHHLGVCYARRGNTTEAIGALALALKLHETVYSPDHPTTAEVLITLGGVLLNAQKWADAELVLTRAWNAHRKTAAGTGAGTAATPSAPSEAAELLSIALARCGKYAAAEALIAEQITAVGNACAASVRSLPASFVASLTHDALPPATANAESKEQVSTGGSGGDASATAQFFAACTDVNQIRYAALRINHAKFVHCRTRATPIAPNAIAFVPSTDAVNDCKRARVAAAAAAVAAANAATASVNAALIAASKNSPSKPAVSTPSISVSPAVAAADIDRMKAAAAAAAAATAATAATATSASPSSAASMFDTGSSTGAGAYNPFAASAAAAAPLRQCFNSTCGKREATAGLFKRCGRCKTVCYCSDVCQAAHWPTHKPVCSPVTVSTAAKNT